MIHSSKAVPQKITVTAGRKTATMVAALIGLILSVVQIEAFAMHHEKADDFTKAWAAADSARAEADKVGFEWVNTAKMLEQAKIAQSEGDKDKAMALVAAALEQSKDAQAQAERESTVWQARVLKK